MFFTIKLRSVLVFILVLLLGIVLPTLATVYISKKASAKTEKVGYTIVLDAGHGGRDGGCQGVNTEITEAELNLAVVKKLKTYLENIGFDVVLTRTDSGGLYDATSENKKMSDMEARQRIIDKANADLVVSIHMNSFSMPSEKGAQCFFQEGDEIGQNIATIVQQQLIKNIANARSFANRGDYYILATAKVPTIIVECGFLSNPEEEILLSTEEYQEKIAYSIMSGIFAYFISSQN